jgi:phosphoenolpyruvate carboxykinase (GTP)
MAMLPFIGYHAGDYLQHWIDTGKSADAAKLPGIFYVNWFRKDDEGRILWPGFRENSRVLKWAIERMAGTAGARETPIGWVPDAEDLDLSGLEDDPADIEASLAVDPDEWRAEIPGIEEWFDKIGDKLPSPVRDELAALEQRLG